MILTYEQMKEKNLGCFQILNHWYSNEWCRDEYARSQEELQNIAKQIKANCELKESHYSKNFKDETVCVYHNENLDIKYIVKDIFGHISEIDEIRCFYKEKED